ncbi:MAG: helix-turn-helix transcriptional regulator [Rhodobacter sp.]|nr:helix-turn-helix transcriptional regulator [Rhodobacter sp.]
MNFDSLLLLIDRIYENSQSQKGWEPVLNDIADALGAELASLAMVAPRLGVVTIVSPRTDPGIIPDFQDHWHAEDITMGATMGAPVDRIVTLKDSGREAFLKSAFYNEYWRKTGHAAERLRVNLVKSPHRLVNFGLSPHARDDELSVEMLKAIAILQPHLKRGFEIEETLRRAELSRAQGFGRPQSGAVLVTADARVILADMVAETHLARGTPLNLRNGRLMAMSARDTATIRSLIAGCTGGRGDPPGGHYRIGGGEVPVLEIDVVPILNHADAAGFGAGAGIAAPAALVIIGDPERRKSDMTGRLRRQFNLTRAEARVAVEMLNGDGRDAVARRLGLSPNTVRTHLSKVFEKTGTQRQAELIRVLMEPAASAG